MCGIIGIYSFKHNLANKESYVNWCLQTMQHRGPDSNGIWQHKNYITGFVRLAIRDVSPSGSQPMVSECGNYCLTFNGEIYNAEDYKFQLQQKGVVFKSTSDTEILLYALIHFGLDFVLNEFDGMFAFSFYNSILNEVVVARDRLGIKPIYIGFNGSDDIIFSSQYDHIINYEKLQNENLDAAAIASFLQLGFIADGLGAVNNTQLLPHGHYIKINTSGYAITAYFDVLHKQKNSNAVIDEIDVLSTVQSQLISDVPLGTFMSGGVDSSLLTLLANKHKPITAFTISTGDSVTDEREKAVWFSNKFKIPQVVKSINEQEIEEVVAQNIKAYTEPFADFSSLPSLLISKIARKEVKVVLSGDGPDELFWGYARNSKMIKVVEKFYRSKLTNLVDYSLSKLSITKKTISKRLFTSPTFADYYYKSLFLFGSELWLTKIYKIKPTEAPFSRFIKEKTDILETDIDAAMNTIWNYEMNIHLQRILLKMDRASMYQSLESRVPYLSNAIIEIAAQTSWKQCIVDNNGKNNIKQLLANYTGDEFVYSTKKGFDIPMNQWINGSLKNNIIHAMNNMPKELLDLFHVKELNKMLNRHFAGKEQNGNLIWAIFSLINWYNCHRNSYKISTT